MGHLPVMRTVRNALTGPFRPDVLFIFVETIVWAAVLIVALFIALGFAGFGGPGADILDALKAQIPASEAGVTEAVDVSGQSADETETPGGDTATSGMENSFADFLESMEEGAVNSEEPNAELILAGTLAVFALLLVYLSIALPVAIHRTIALNQRPYSVFYVFRQLRWVMHYVLAAILNGLITVVTVLAVGGGLFYLGTKALEIDFSGLTEVEGAVETVEPNKVIEAINAMSQQDQYVLLGLVAAFVLSVFYVSLRILPGLPAAAVRGIGSWWAAVKATNGNVLRILATAILVGAVLTGAFLGLLRLFPVAGSEIMLLMIGGISMIEGMDPKVLAAYVAIQYYLGVLGIVYLTEVYRGIAGSGSRRARAGGRRRRRR